jgi:proton-translocating NADH-quinone oxidoreductase chain L
MTSHWQAWLYVAAVLIPLAAFTIEALLGRWLGRRNAWVATGAIGSSLVLSLIGLASFLPHLGRHDAAAGHSAAPETPFAWTAEIEWLGVGPMQLPGATPEQTPVTLPALRIPLSIRIDALAVLMFAMVSLVSTLIHVYSMGYMADDPGYPRFFTFLSLFCFSMLALVASNSIFLVFMCWELVGICSYLLIGFWFEEARNVRAANKAFIVNRVGDVGMLVGLGVLWTAFGTFSISEITGGLNGADLRDAHHRLTRGTATQGDPGDRVVVALARSEAASGDAEIPVRTTRSIPYGLLVVAGLGIFAGCVGKSAQFPLHVWLPDAMAGPTPVSALIHAATMVAAGVYLVGRFYALFTHEVLLGIAYTGAITLLIGATTALVQTDYKKVLAYSTVSQLGFMMLGLGVGGWAAGLFHLLTHAFFKALLFLGAGSVHHAVHTYEMAPLGGLFRRMPTTARTMLIATLAISGIPLFSGFYSKDAILGSALQFTEHYPDHALLFALPILGALLTAFYMFRMWFLLFDGEPREAHLADHAHESPAVMTVPLIVLAVLALVAGYPRTVVPIDTPVLEGWLETAEPLPSLVVGPAARWTAMGLSVAAALSGVAGAALFYSRRQVISAQSVATGFRPIYRFFQRKWYFDELYNWLFVQPIMALARSVAWLDRRGIDGLVDGTARLTRSVSRFSGVFDNGVVDRLATTFGWVLYGLGQLGRSIQTGHIRTYLTLMALAMLGLFVGVYFWIR